MPRAARRGWRMGSDCRYSVHREYHVHRVSAGDGSGHSCQFRGGEGVFPGDRGGAAARRSGHSCDRPWRCRRAGQAVRAARRRGCPSGRVCEPHRAQLSRVRKRGRGDGGGGRAPCTSAVGRSDDDRGRPASEWRSRPCGDLPGRPLPPDRGRYARSSEAHAYLRAARARRDAGRRDGHSGVQCAASPPAAPAGAGGEFALLAWAGLRPRERPGPGGSCLPGL